jgi:hypothetical protein
MAVAIIAGQTRSIREITAIPALPRKPRALWTGDRVRLKRAGVPAECRTARTEPKIALAEIDRVIAPVCPLVLCWRMPVTG